MSKSPIEAALARVRELREAEKRMTPGPWADVTTQYQQPGYPRALIHHSVFNDVITPNIVARDSAGIAALRNAAEPMLWLLEALLVERHVLGVAHPDEHTTVNRALAAFVDEGNTAIIQVAKNDEAETAPPPLSPLSEAYIARLKAMSIDERDAFIRKLNSATPEELRALMAKRKEPADAS